MTSVYKHFKLCVRQSEDFQDLLFGLPGVCSWTYNAVSVHFLWAILIHYVDHVYMYYYFADDTLVYL